MGVLRPAGHAMIVPKPPPEKEPYDILSFPAGLIPKLARRHLKCEPLTLHVNAASLDPSWHISAMQQGVVTLFNTPLAVPAARVPVNLCKRLPKYLAHAAYCKLEGSALC
jgi:hypothetical protein